MASEQPVVDAVVGDADRDRADDLPVGVAQRDLAAGGAAQGAAVDLHDLAARERVARVGRDVAADPVGVGVRPADPVQVHDHDVLGARGPADPFGRLLHGAVGRRPGVEEVGGQCGYRRRRSGRWPGRAASPGRRAVR